MDKPKPDSLSLFLTQPGPCPYLEGQVEQKVLAMLDEETAPLAPALIGGGFRRMQKVFYRQRCPACRACIATRLRLAGFRPEKYARVLRRNADISASVEPALATPERYALFSQYQQGRHAGGEMSRMAEAEFKTMVEEHTGHARFLVCRQGGREKAVMLFDELLDGASAVYSFFDPAESRRSLGTWMILKLAEYVRQTGRPYLYLGFWIKGSPKMSYKAKFQPLEIFEGDKWTAFGE